MVKVKPKTAQDFISLLSKDSNQQNRINTNKSVAFNALDKLTSKTEIQEFVNQLKADDMPVLGYLSQKIAEGFPKHSKASAPSAAESLEKIDNNPDRSLWDQIVNDALSFK